MVFDIVDHDDCLLNVTALFIGGPHFELLDDPGRAQRQQPPDGFAGYGSIIVDEHIAQSAIKLCTIVDVEVRDDILDGFAEMQDGVAPGDREPVRFIPLDDRKVVFGPAERVVRLAIGKIGIGNIAGGALVILMRSAQARSARAISAAASANTRPRSPSTPLSISVATASGVTIANGS